MTTEAEADELLTCGHCEAEIPESEWEAGDGLCAACLAAHFKCEVCGERTHRDDQHATMQAHCQCCGDEAVEAMHQEALDTAADQLRELTEALIDSEDLAAIANAVKLLKTLPK